MSIGKFYYYIATQIEKKIKIFETRGYLIYLIFKLKLHEIKQFLKYIPLPQQRYVGPLHGAG